MSTNRSDVSFPAVVEDPVQDISPMGITKGNKTLF